MKKTEKYNRMIESFACDFSNAVRGDETLKALDKRLKKWDLNLVADIEKLQELSQLIKAGKAEIHVHDDYATSTSELWKESIMRHFTKGD